MQSTSPTGGQAIVFDNPADPTTKSILRCLWLNPRISRVDVAKAVGLDQSTVSRVTANLLEARVICVAEEGPAGPQGGRKPIYLQVNPAYGCVAGIEVQSDQHTLVIINLVGEILLSRTSAHPTGDHDLLGLLQDAVADAEVAAAPLGLPLLGIGFGLPGLIDSDKGIVIQSNPLAIGAPVPVVELLKTSVSRPVRIEHDARCCCLAELTFHRGRTPPNFLFVLGEFRSNSITTPDYKALGIGLGLVLGEKVHVGTRHAAGEFKSVLHGFHPNNQILGLTDEELKLLEHSPKIQGAFARELGRNLALLVNVLDLSSVIVGGGIEKLGQPLLDTIAQEVEANKPYPNFGSFEIRFTELGDKAAAYGAAAMFLDTIFSA